MPAGNFIYRLNHTLAERLGWLTAWDSVPVPRFCRYAHDIYLARLQRLVKCLQVFAIRGYWAHLAEPDLFEVLDDDGRHAQTLGQGSHGFQAAPQGTAVDGVEVHAAESFG